MKNEITTTVKTTQKVVFDLREEPVIEKWPGFSHRDKRVKLEVMSFNVVQVDDDEPEVGNLKICGWLVKKDGTVSGITWVEAEMWRQWVTDSEGGRWYMAEARSFGHLIEAARKVARVVLAG